MNEEQALLILQQTLRLERLADDLAAPTRRRLREIIRLIAEEVEGFPGEDFRLISSAQRFQQWRQALPQVEALLQEASDLLISDLEAGLAVEAPRQAAVARQYLAAAGLEVAAAADPLRSGPFFFGQEITPAQQFRAAQGPQRLQGVLDRLFSRVDPITGDRQPTFTPGLVRQIDQIVSRGFLGGETNEEIARVLRRQGAAATQREATALARTSVLSFAADARQEVFTQNESVIGGWEYDATMDYRVCPICAPWDGRTAKRRTDLPQLPQHVACRCVVNPLTPVELALREEAGPQRRTIVELRPYNGQASKPPTTSNQRVYARPVRGADGQRYWRVARDLPPKSSTEPVTMADFLVRTNRITRVSVLGSQGRAQWFDELIADGVSAEDALLRVTKGPRHWPSVEARGREPAGGMSNSRAQTSDGKQNPPLVRRR